MHTAMCRNHFRHIAIYCIFIWLIESLFRIIWIIGWRREYMFNGATMNEPSPECPAARTPGKKRPHREGSGQPLLCSSKTARRGSGSCLCRVAEGSPRRRPWSARKGPSCAWSAHRRGRRGWLATGSGRGWSAAPEFGRDLEDAPLGCA
jgi:hypothetical protein